MERLRFARHVPEAHGVVTITATREGWMARLDGEGLHERSVSPAPSARRALAEVARDPDSGWVAELAAAADRRWARLDRTVA
jgi:hypothetical protein